MPDAPVPGDSTNSAANCQNCHVLLTGPWCANCGQKHQPEILTLGHFLGEAFEDITHADSRVWRTLWALASKPGHLTREFFSGRRSRYLPPVRLYLVVSLVFFLLAGLADERQTPAVIIDRPDTAGAAPAQAEDPGKACTDFEYNGPFRDAVRARLPAQCRKIVADNGRSLSHAFVQNLPKGLFVLLPLIAAFMKLLYWRPRRYYVEHLLLLLHNHTYLFVGYGLLLSLGFIFPDSNAVGLASVVFNAFLVWYFYRGMRVYYGQGRALTLAKFAVLGMVYAVTAVSMMIAVLIFSVSTL